MVELRDKSRARSPSTPATSPTISDFVPVNDASNTPASPPPYQESVAKRRKSSGISASLSPTTPPSKHGSSNTRFTIIDAPVEVPALTHSPAPDQDPQFSSGSEHLSSLTQEPLVDYRPPESVSETPPPELVYPESSDQWWSNQGNDIGNWATPPQTWPSDNNPTNWAEDAPNIEPWVDSSWDYPSDPPSDWWNFTNRVLTPQRPGPGMLPSALEEKVLADELYKIEITGSPSPTTTPGFVPPTAIEVADSIPHPAAFYSNTHNGWVFLMTVVSQPLPTMIERISTDATNTKPIPHFKYREIRTACLETFIDPHWGIEHPRTHHFHLYESAVDSSEVGFICEDMVAIKPVMSSPSSSPTAPDAPRSQMETDTPTTQFVSKPHLLDLYICRHCSTYVLASHDVIPGVIPSNILTSFATERGQNPQVGRSTEASTAISVEALIKSIENVIFAGVQLGLNTMSNTFQTRIGWNDTTAELYSRLGFYRYGDGPRLAPPSVDIATEIGRRNRAVLLRAWVELNAWHTQFRESRARELPPYRFSLLPGTCISADPIRADFESEIGADPQRMPRINGFADISRAVRDSFTVLGMTPETHSADLAEYAYNQQIQCDPFEIPLYLEALTVISDVHGIPGQLALIALVPMEKSKGYYSKRDLAQSQQLLGYGETGTLGIPWDEEVDDQFLMRSYLEAVRVADERLDWEGQDQHDIHHQELKEALLMLCKSTGRPAALDHCQNELRLRAANPRDAYVKLGASKAVDDDTLIAIYQLRVEDSPALLDEMRAALMVIAHDRDSERLRQLVLTGQDPGDLNSAVVHPEWPRGLHQLGNTCYLNSLLQYFFTIKDLRDAVEAGLFNQGAEFADEDAKRATIGGRMITSRELTRSRRFVNQLRDLFVRLSIAQETAILPEVELAKLALMTSKDEEAETKTTDTAANSTGSADTDSTLVDGVATGGSASPVDKSIKLAGAPASPTSILGKRSAAFFDVMEVDETVAPTLENKEPLPKVEASSAPTVRFDVDVEMTDGSSSTQLVSQKQPPPLPPRKREVITDMMFGKQNDVAECMDNCIFQIEAAIQFDFHGAVTPAQKNIVKHLFYGKKKQRVTPLAEEGKPAPSVSEKEEIFAQLLVNVSDEGFDLYDGLGGFLDDTVEFEGKSAKMEVSLVELPPILQIQLQRVQFDRETLQPKKNNAHIKFEETLHMDRFTENANPEKKAQSSAIQAELQQRRDRIAALLHGPAATALEETRAYLSKTPSPIDLPEVDEYLLEYLRNEKALVELEIEDNRARIKVLKEQMEELWAGEHDPAAEYELSSVFIHRGTSPSWGHYFFYSRSLPERPDEWFKYNDSEVSLVGKDTVLADGTGSTANPYLLVYARKGANVIDTVHRIAPKD